MKAVNLVPKDARRGRGSGSGPQWISADSFGPAQAVVGVLLIVIALIGLRVLADNHVNNRKATLAAMQTQFATEQAQASRLTTYASFVQAAQQREDQVSEIAEQRFPWQRTLDEMSRVMPATTTLTSLSASTSGASTATGSTTTSTDVSTGGGPSFTLSGCADTPNQNGTATLLRRLKLLTGVTDVGFQSSTREASCGNSFSIDLSFGASGTATAASSSSSTTTAVATSSSTANATATPAG